MRPEVIDKFAALITAAYGKSTTLGGIVTIIAVFVTIWVGSSAEKAKKE